MALSGDQKTRLKHAMSTHTKFGPVLKILKNLHNRLTTLEETHGSERMLSATEPHLNDPYLMVKQKNYKLAAAIASLPCVNDYIAELCGRLHSIYTEHGLDTSEMEPETSTYGQALTSDIEGVLAHGNLRERMALLVNIACGKKEFLWCVFREMRSHLTRMTNDSHSLNQSNSLNQSVLNRRLHRAYLMTGVTDINTLAHLADDSQSGFRDVSDGILDFPHDTSVLLSRAGPDPLRFRRQDAERSLHRLPADHICPPLGQYEKAYIEKHSPYWDNAFSPWETGLMAWVINPNNLYAKIARKQKQAVISGPSGTTDGILQLAELFDDFDVELTVLACAAFICGANHHSAWEVLLAAIPFGLQYSSDVDAYEYIHLIVRRRDMSS
jgi:hypothetical protein